METLFSFLHEFLLPAFVYAMFLGLAFGPKLRPGLKNLLIWSLCFLPATLIMSFRKLPGYAGYEFSLLFALIWTLWVCVTFFAFWIIDPGKPGILACLYKQNALDVFFKRRDAGIILVMLVWLPDVLLISLRGHYFNIHFNPYLEYGPLSLAVLVCLRVFLRENSRNILALLFQRQPYFRRNRRNILDLLFRFLPFLRKKNRNIPDAGNLPFVSAETCIVVLLYAIYAYHLCALVTADSVLILSALLLGLLSIVLLFAGKRTVESFICALTIAVCLAGIGDLLVSVRDSGSSFRLDSVYEMGFLLSGILSLLLLCFIPARVRNAGLKSTPDRRGFGLATRLGALVCLLVCALTATWLIFPPVVVRLTAEYAGPETLAAVLCKKGYAYLAHEHNGLSLEELRRAALSDGRLPGNYGSYTSYFQINDERRLKVMVLLNALMKKDAGGQGLTVLSRDPAFYCRRGGGFKSNYIYYRQQLACEALEIAFARRDVTYAAHMAPLIQGYPDSVDLGFLAAYDETTENGAPFVATDRSWERLEFFRQAGFRLRVEAQMEVLRNTSANNHSIRDLVDLLMCAGLTPANFVYHPGTSYSEHFLFDSLPEEPEEQQYLLRLFLEKGLDPNLAKENGESLLQRFVDSRKYDLIRPLLEAGADPLHTDRGGNSPYKAMLHKADQGRSLRILLSWALDDTWPQTDAEKKAARQKLHELGLDRVPDTGKTPLAELEPPRGYFIEQRAIFKSLGYME